MNSEKQHFKMIKNTFKVYKEQIQSHYEIAKKEDVSGILFNPSPAQMRTLSLIVLDKGINGKEEEIFQLFFEKKDTEPLKKAIENYNIDKFKPIISFLKNERDSENAIRVEMSAILINFHPRPYSLFSKSSLIENQFETKGNELSNIDSNGIIKNSELLNSRSDVFRPFKSSITKKVGVGSILVLGLFGAKSMFFKEKECMEWKEDHYEIVDCQSEEVGFTNTKIIRQYNQLEFSRKELSVCDTTKFFNGDKPLVWYSKKNNEVQFFNIDGENPENGAELRKVSQYIIDKYVEDCE